RVVQEALTNVFRHARATRVSVHLERRPDEVRAIVEDNGRGFDAGAVSAAPERLGLLGMRERADGVNGTLEIESSPGSGTTVFLCIPLPAGEPSGGG
ncbi:MAG TPA: ATP-binding protein, partial [Armatimonadota bacterium]|nr:ATP-binding protein [Armatimonadota bacterium]